jgi:hypothetical protein
MVRSTKALAVMVPMLYPGLFLHILRAAEAGLRVI